MAKKKNPDSSNRPQTPEEWAKSTPHVDKATGKPSGMTEHQRALQVSKEQGRPVADIIEQKFKAYHVNKGTIASKDMPAGRTESRRQADRRRGTDGPAPTEVRTSSTGARFRAAVGAPDPTREAREANVPQVSESEIGAAAAQAEKRGGEVIPELAEVAALDKRARDKAAKAGGKISSVLSGPGGTPIRKGQQESLHIPAGVTTEAGPAYNPAEGPVPEGTPSHQQAQMEEDLKGRDKLKRKRISDAMEVNPATGKERHIKTGAEEVARAGGASPGADNMTASGPDRDAQGNVIQRSMSVAPHAITVMPPTVAVTNRDDAGAPAGPGPHHADESGRPTIAQVPARSKQFDTTPQPSSPALTGGERPRRDNIAIGTARPASANPTAVPSSTTVLPFSQWAQGQNPNIPDHRLGPMYEAHKALKENEAATRDATIDKRITDRENQ